MLKKVLIIGRPNVGKSSLFNRLVKKRKALVANQAGVTRDILKQKTSWWGTQFEIWDSGGLGSASHPALNKSSRVISRLIDQKVEQAISEVDLLLWVMDAKVGYLAEDKKIFQQIKKSGKTFFALINKVDKEKQIEELLADFASLGIELLPCAFEANKGIHQIVEWILKHSSQKLKQPETVNLSSSQIKLLILGKPNAGKSSLCNGLLKEDRMITSQLRGTTIDTVEASFKHKEYYYQLMDAAGFCKTTGKNLISLAKVKWQQIVKITDLVLLLIDAKSGPSRQDARLLELCAAEHKAVILVVNKWDLMHTVDKHNYRANIQKKFSFYADLPIVFISALKKQGFDLLLKKINDLYAKLCFRISTAELNRFLMAMTRGAPAPVWGTQDVKFFYFTQVSQNPPHFIAFANYPKAVPQSYKRFLIRKIQNEWKLKAVPIHISIRPRRGSKTHV